MKLHLPTRLRSAVLACITAVAAIASTVGTGVVTTGVVAYTIAASHAYAEPYVFSGADNANFSTRLPDADTGVVFNMENTGTSNWSNGFTYAGAVLIGASGATDTGLCLNNGNQNQTLTLSGKVTGTGLISKVGAGINNTVALTGDVTEFTGNYVLGSTVTFTLRFGSGGEAPATTATAGIGGTGSLTFTTGNNTLAYNYSAGTVHVTNEIVRDGSVTSKVSFGGGANYSVHKNADISELTLNGGIVTFGGTTTLGSVTGDEGGVLGNSGALTLNGTVSLHSAIMNGGSVAFGENVKFDLSHLSAESGVYTIFTGTAVDMSSLTVDNLLGTQVGYAYTFGTDGTITATMTCQNLTWTGGPLTWAVGSTIGDGTFANGDIVNFTTANANVTLGADINSSMVTVDTGVTVTLAGAERVLTAGETIINGTLDLGDVSLSSPKLSLAGELVLHATTNLAEGTVVTHEGNAAKVTVTDGEVLFNGQLDGFNGTITAGSDGTVKMGKTSAFGSIDNTIKVNKGGVLDINGQKDHQYIVTLNGGSLVNNGTGVGVGSMQFRGLNVTADSEIGGTGQFGVIGRGYAATTVNLNGNTLTKTGTNTVNLYNTTVSGGTLRVEGGTLEQKNASHINCDIVVAGGNFTGDACTMEGDHTLGSDGEGGSITCAITSSGAVTVNTAAGSTLTMEGALTTAGFSKTGAGTLAMTGALTVNKLLSMNYEGALTLGDVSVADGAVLSYGAANLNTVINLGASAIAGSVKVDVFSLTQAQLQAGINLGIEAEGFDKSKLVVSGLSTSDYSFETKDGRVWLKAKKAAESAWDRNWGASVLAQAPATLESRTIAEDTFLSFDYSESPVIAVQLAGCEAANNVFGGILNTDVTSSNTITKDVWMEVTGGTYGILAGGNNCVSWQGSAAQNLAGDTHIMLKGGSAAQLIGGHYKDGFGPSFVGSSYISVMKGSNVTGNIVGGNTSAHSQTTNFTGNSNIFVYSVLGDNGSTMESLGNQWIIGGSAWIANGAGGTQNFNGSTNVTIDLSDYTGEAATFVKSVVGGNFTAAANSTVQSLGGDTHVTVKGNDSVTFSGWVIGGARSSTCGTNTQAGGSVVVLDGGNYTGDVVGGFYQHGNSTTTMGGTAKLTITGGTFANDVRGAAHVNGGTATVGGSVVTIQNGTFAKDVVGGAYNSASNSHLVTVGDTTVAMKNGAITGNLIGGNRHVTGDGLMANGNISVSVAGGSVGGSVIGGHYISGSGAASMSAEIGDISVAVSGGTVNNVYGGSLSDRNYAAGTITQGNVEVSLNGCSVTGDVYIGGRQNGTTKMASASTTLEIGAGVTLTDGKVLSGGYYGDNGSSVAGSRTLKLTTTGAQDLSGMTVKDFDVVNVTNASGVVTLADIAQTHAESGVTKKGAGTLTLGENFTAASLTVAEGKVDISAATALGGILTLGNGSALQTSTADVAMGVSKLVLGTGMTLAITGANAEYTDPIKLLSGLTEATISGLTFVEEDGSKYADITGIFTVSGVSEDYNRVMLEGGTLSLVSSAAPVEELAWLGGDGAWNATNAAWTPAEGSGLVAYVDGAAVTIGSTETTGGTITVSGAQKATRVTIAGSDYKLNAENGASLTIKQDLVINANVTATLQFLPSVGGGIVVNGGSALDATAVSINRDMLGTLLDKTTGSGTLLVTGGKEFMLNKSLTVSTNLDVAGKLELNANESRNATVTVGSGASLTVHGGALILESTAGLVVNGGKVDAQDGITLGHAEAGHPGHLSMSGGEIKTTTINLRDDRTANTVNITGGKLIVTGANAFTGTGTATTVAISNATLTNGETDMAFNHASTLTDTTVQANADTKITVGGEGLTTTLAGKLTTKGTTELVGTMSTAGLTGLVNSGDLTVKADTISVAGLDNTGTMTVEGKLVVSGGTAKGGTVSAADVELGGASTFTKLTATGTVSGSAMLTVGDGSSIGTLNNGKLTVSAGTVEVANATTLNQLVNNGTLTVGGALSLTGNVTTGGNISATSLSLSGNGTKLSGTTLQTGTINIGSLDHNAPLTLGTLTAAGTGVQFNVTQADLESKGNGSTTTLAVLNTAYGSGLTLNGTEASVTYGGITYTIGLSDDGKNILVTGEGSGGWQSTDGKWTSSSSWGDGEPGATDTAYFFGDGTASVELDGDQTVGSVVISSKTDGTSSVDDYTFSGDKLTVNGDVQVDHGSLTIENEVTAQNLVLNKRGSSSDSSSFAIGESGKLSVGDIAFNGIDATIANAGEIVISGAADFAMTGGGSVEVAEGGDVTLQGDTTAASVVNSGTTSVTGTLAADSVESSGTMEIGADLAATSVENSGTMTVTGSVAADSVENTGTMSIGGDVTSSAVTSTDTMTVTGGVTADSVENSGTMSIGGDVAAAAVTSTDKMTVTGCLTSDSVTNGGTMEIGTDVNAENGLVDNGGSLTVGGNMIAAGTQNAAGAAMAVTGDMNVGSMQNMGTTKVDGNLVAGTFSNGGTVTVKGSAALTESTDNGGTLSAASADLAGGDTFTRLKVTGTVKTPGSLAVGNGSSMGKLDGDSLTINGTGANVSIGSDTTLTELNSEGTLNLGKKALTLNGSGNTAGSVKAGSITVNGTDNTFGDMSGTDLTLNATGTTVNDLSINSILFNDLTGVDADTAAMTMTGTLNTDAETVMVYLGESVISSLLSTTGEYKLIGGDAVVKDDFTLDEAAVQAFYSVAKTVSLQQGSLMLVVDDMSLADRVWNVGSTTSSAGLEISPDGMHIETPAVLGTIQNVHVAGTKTLDVTDMTDGTLAVRNLTGDAASELTIKGAPSKQVALLVNDNSRAYASKGSLRSLVLDGATASVAQEDGSSAKLSVTDNVTLTNGSKLSISNAALRTGALNAEDAAAGSLSGTVEITGKGGVFNGAYGKDAAFKLASGASQKLVASDKVAVLGSGTASVMKDAAGNKNLREVSMQGGQLVLGNMTDTTLGITEASSVTDGTVAMKLRTDSMDDGNSGAVIDAPAMDLTGTTLQIGQADKATTMKVATGSAKNILATLPEGTMPETVVLEGATLNKYFASATVNADGTVTGNRNTTYFTGTVVPEVTEANAAAGMEMLDAALVELNPQVNAPEGALAGIMNALEQHADVDTDRLGAAVAGSGLAGLSMAAAGDVERQLRAIRNRTTTMGVDQCVVNEELPYVNAWANAEGDYTKLNSDSMMPGYTMSSWGATVGMDVDCTPHFTCGLAVTAMYGKYTSSTADNVDAELSNYYLSAFARYTRHRWTHTAVATFGLSDYDVTRNINYGIGNTEITGNTNGSSFGAMYELGYVVALGENGTTCLQPVVNVNFRHVSVGGYAENSSDAALTVDDMDANIVTFGMGARLQSVVGENLYNRSSIFECRAMLKLDAGDTQGEAKTALRGVPGTHTVKSAEMGKFGVEFGAGVTVPVGQDSGSIFVDASAEFRSGYTGVNGTVGYRVNF